MGDLFANPLHLTLLIIVIVLLFGASKLGDVGGALGKSIREFKREATNDDQPKQAPPSSTAGYVAPVQQTYTQPVPPATAPPAYVQAPEPQRPIAATPGDYRPAGAPQVAPQQPQAPVNAPPEYRGN